MTDQVR